MKKLTNSEIDEKLIYIFDKVTDMTVEDINLNTKISELKMDSLDKVEMIMKVEREFDISIDDEFAENYIMDKIVHIKDLKKILKEKYNICDIKEERKEKIEKINDLK